MRNTFIDKGFRWTTAALVALLWFSGRESQAGQVALDPADLDQAIDSLPHPPARDVLAPLRARLAELTSLERPPAQEVEGLATAIDILRACQAIRLDGQTALPASDSLLAGL
jgi:hypothetical protein